MRGILSTKRIAAYAVGASFFVLLVTMALQWLIYDDWLHETGPLRLVGGTVSAVATFAFLYRWFSMERARSLDAQRRFEMIAQANDRIRNKLQALVGIKYIANDGVADSMREAVAAIDAALDGIVEDARVGIQNANSTAAPATASKHAHSA